MTDALISGLADVEFESLLSAARDSDRRGAPRYALFATVTLRPVTSPTTVVSAFSREISTTGVGLLHAAPIVKGDRYEIDIEVDAVRIRKTACVTWCRLVDHGWYLSGCRFV
jgi:hypothetical protein